MRWFEVDRAMDSQDISLRWILNRRPAVLPVWKRLLDLGTILLLSPLLLLLGLVLSLLVKISSPGPIVFRQRRVGYKGGEFTCFKFRTMRLDADSVSHQNH